MLDLQRADGIINFGKILCAYMCALLHDRVKRNITRGLINALLITVFGCPVAIINGAWRRCSHGRVISN